MLIGRSPPAALWRAGASELTGPSTTGELFAFCEANYAISHATAADARGAGASDIVVDLLVPAAVP